MIISQMNPAVGERVITLGEQGDFLLVCEKGKLECKREFNGEEKILKVIASGDVVGELALLYNAPRGANVDVSEEGTVVWSLGRESFNYIVKDAAIRKRNEHSAFLSNVPLLKNMNEYVIFITLFIEKEKGFCLLYFSSHSL
jgi:CRP-like cAMP-binding protein